MLTTRTALDYLLERKLIQREQLVYGSVKVSDVSGRNRAFRIDVNSSEGFIVKQADPAVPLSDSTTAVERRFYALAASDTRLRGVRHFLPNVRHMSDIHQTIVMDLVPRAKNAGELLRLCQGSDDAKLLGELIGGTLAQFHLLQVSGFLESGDGYEAIAPGLPWLLMLSKPRIELLTSLSLANVETLKAIQRSPDLQKGLQRALESWRSSTIIHGDIRSSNLLVSEIAAKDGRPIYSLTLIDWELVQVGDPAWDIAASLVDTILIWIWSMDISLTTAQMAESATFPLLTLQSVIRELWGSYKDTRGFSSSEQKEMLARVTLFCAAHLIKTSIEIGQSAYRMSGYTLLLLQLAENFVRDPQISAAYILGIDSGDVY